MFLVLELVSVHILFDILLVYFIQYIQYFYLTEIHIQMGGQNLFHNKRYNRNVLEYTLTKNQKRIRKTTANIITELPAFV